MFGAYAVSSIACEVWMGLRLCCGYLSSVHINAAFAVLTLLLLLPA